MEREDIINELEQYGVYNPISCASDNIARLIDYIVELTEQNERLGKDLMSANDSIRKKRTKIKELKEENERARADTVRKMHSMLCEGRVSNDNVVIAANQVAKEMLEGGNE